MIGTSSNAQGGVAAVVNALHGGGLFGLYEFEYIPTHSDGSRLSKLCAAVVAFARLGLRLIARERSLLHVHIASRASFWRKSILVLPWFLLRRCVIFHLHGGEFHLFYEQESSRLARKVIRFVIERADVVVVLSLERKEWIAQAFPKARVRVIYNPAPGPSSRPPAPSAEGRILFLGKIQQQKGVRDLVTAFSQVRSTGAEATLILCGEGDKQAVRRFAAECNLKQEVVTPGWVQGETKEQLLSQASVFALPSYNEGLPMSILEAMAYGVPIVSTPVGGIPDAVTHGVEGILVPPGDVQALAAALQTLLADDELRMSMGRAAQRKVETDFSINAITRQWVALYAEYGVVPVIR